ncbi:MAG: glycerol kinase GlpK [Candidatus Rokuibacteriota bacterium]
MPHLLALDQGTTSSRAIVFTEEGAVAAMAQQELTQFYPGPGLVEHDPDEIWSTQLATAREAMREAGVGPADIGAIGVTNQRETVVMWERRSGRPIHHAIVWQDRRTAGLLEGLRRAGHEPLIRERTGLVLDPYFSGSKITWLLDHVPGARARAEQGELAVGTVDTWLINRLSGGAVHVTDVSNASRTLLCDIRRGLWDDALLELFRVPRALLPEVCPSSGVVAETERTLFGRSLPVAGVAGDQQAALFGQLCGQPGMVKNTYGTGCFMLMHTGRQRVDSRHNLLTTVAWQLATEPLEYALEGSVFSAGAAIQWLRDGLGLIGSAPEINSLAARVPDAGGIYLVPAFTGLGAPHWDPHARGCLVGLTRGTTAAHLARAVLESIAYQVADVLEAMVADSGTSVVELRVDGGAAASDLLLQFQADLLGVAVQRPRVTETTALGVAYLAGLGVNLWHGMVDLAGQRHVERTFVPRMAAAEREARLARWRRAVDRAKGWAEG